MNKDEFNERCYALQRELNRVMGAHLDSLPPADGALVAATVTYSLMALVAANVQQDDDAAVSMIQSAPWSELVAHSRAAIEATRAEREPPP